jgi:hypothetical protein
MARHERGSCVPKKPIEHSLLQIETTQAALRDCIKRAQELADDSERLIRRHKTVVMGPRLVPG